MSKRFRDTDIWKKPWFRSLSPAEKMAWQYITDNCDNVGIWEPDFELADFFIGEKVDYSALIGKCNDNIEVLSSGKWWIVSFCDFQYGELKPNSIPHQSYIKLLKKHGLFDRACKGLPNPCQRVKDKDKDKDKEKDKEKEKEKEIKNIYGEYENVTLTEKELEKLNAEFGPEKTKQAFEFLSAYKVEKGYKTKSDYLTLRRWVFDAVEKSSKGGFKNFAGKPISDMPRMQAILDETMRLYGPKPEGKTNES
jgi:hypothetical protein